METRCKPRTAADIKKLTMYAIHVFTKHFSSTYLKFLMSFEFTTLLNKFSEEYKAKKVK